MYEIFCKLVSGKNNKCIYCYSYIVQLAITIRIKLSECLGGCLN